ncbi:sulfotransferase family protein [Burkholderia stagnalis]|uniref:sulfotransferase family protein n=1 Tax=Burkholderia stagnalis TaxID=1503054 RepID=UPI0018C62E55|nr:sulfotransferase [Burkholderia stagnalis]
MTDASYEITFCVGAPRSGTTLVNSLMCEGDSAFPALPECTYITSIIRLFHDIVEYSDRPRFDAFAKSKETLAHTFSPSIEGLLKIARNNFQHLKAAQLVLKDPELTLYLDVLPTFFDQFKTVCVVRDPRYVVASLGKALSKQNRHLSLEELIAVTYNYYWRASESNLAKSGKIHFVRYEKIVGKDENEFRALERYLGYTVGRSGFGKLFFKFDLSDATHSDNYGKPIIQSNESAPTLTEEQSLRVQQAFVGYNNIYNWWE